MKLIKYFIFLFSIFLFISCDHGRSGGHVDPPRDEAEVYQENLEQIENFLKTHYYKVEASSVAPFYKHIVIDTLDENHTPIFEDENLHSKMVQSGDQEYKLYYLKVREGAEGQYRPTFADKILVSYSAQNMNGDLFNQSPGPQIVDIPATSNLFFNRGQVRGITTILNEFRGASDFTEEPDGSFSYNDDYGIGAVFVPSGLAYFQTPPLAFNVGPYQPFVFMFNLFQAVQMDHDGDGIPSYLEDLNGDQFLYNDDTDGDGNPNFLDSDDDGDEIPTKEEIIVHQPEDRDWLKKEDIEFIDTGNTGTPDYLDPEK